MKDYQAKNIRNIAVIGHGGEGKTTLVEALLFSTGAIDRQGRVEDGTTTTDYDPEEIRRQISISAAIAPLEYQDTKINLVDIPGFFDFAGEMVGPLAVCEGALICVGAVNGLDVGAEKAWAACDKNHNARMIVVNNMDRENANFDKALASLTDVRFTVANSVFYELQVLKFSSNAKLRTNADVILSELCRYLLSPSWR